MVEEIVLIECGESDQLKDNPCSNVNEFVSDTAPGSSIISTQHLLSTVNSKVGIMYHNSLNSYLNFLNLIPQYSHGLILVKLLSMEFIYLELMYMKC